MSDRSLPHDRRTFLLGAAALVVAACSDDGASDEADAPASTATTDGAASNGAASEGGADESATTTSADDATSVESDGDASDVEALTPAMFDVLAICAMAPASAAGPFPTIDRMERREIHEGEPGEPLRLGIRVVDGECAPIPGAVVDIWHCDATGDYSEYIDDGSGKDEGEGSTFCRGLQRADADGIVEFLSIYPGWYEGRAVHIHVTVVVDDDERLTAQLYFDEGYTDTVHQTGVYAEFGPPDTGWDDDFLIGDPSTDGTGVTVTAAPTALGPGTLGLVNLGIEI